MERAAYRVTITGLVQGVGFRPYLHKLAGRFQLSGHVYNTNCSVELLIEGRWESLAAFLTTLREQPPALARIEELTVHKAEPTGSEAFEIVKSSDCSRAVTLVSPDIAVCPDCLNDMKSQPQRLNYPFTNCINCGPRFSIVRELPYDRGQTTMEPFELCPSCRDEYENINDRRYHAQPNACAHCGPVYTLHLGDSKFEEAEEVVVRAAELLARGGLLAIKGVGGFHLVCDPYNREAVARLRERKRREGKPFALMLSSLEAASELAHINEEEGRLLSSAARPIVTLKVKSPFNSLVTAGLDSVGIMLPYMPFHHLLFERFAGEALVMTSGNLSDRPIEISNEGAFERLAPLADALITYNREIHNRLDDSVLFVCRGKSRFIRRSRGYVPEPLRLKGLNPDGIIALGGELKSCFALGKGERVFLSQHIGDLKSWEVELFYRESVERFRRLFRAEPELAVSDLHPAYSSTRYGEELGVELIRVQHHHAHLAAVMIEHELDEPVIGVALDGTGYGPDGTIWGSEFMISDLKDYERILHFSYIPLPGGDQAVRAPWRTALSLFYGSGAIPLRLPFMDMIEDKKVELVRDMLVKDLNCPLSCGAGRLFDGVAALLGLCLESSYEAEGPMLLEALLSRVEGEPAQAGRYGFRLVGGEISFAPMIGEMVQDIGASIPPELVSARFHNTLVRALVEGVKKLNSISGLTKVVLSGGVFLNRYLLEQSENLLEREGFSCYSPLCFPANDGGLALGQLAIAAKRRER